MTNSIFSEFVHRFVDLESNPFHFQFYPRPVLGNLERVLRYAGGEYEICMIVGAGGCCRQPLLLMRSRCVDLSSLKMMPLHRASRLPAGSERRATCSTWIGGDIRRQSHVYVVHKYINKRLTVFKCRNCLCPAVHMCKYSLCLPRN